MSNRTSQNDLSPAMREVLHAVESRVAGRLRESGRDIDADVQRELIIEVLLALGEGGPTGSIEPSTFGARLARLDAVRGMTELAHDMRSPLAAILLLVEPIRRGQKGPVTPVQERQLGLIYGAALSLNALASDIIEAGRSEKTTLVARPFSIRATLDDACALVRPVAEEKRLELGAVYSCVDARMGDASALHRVVLNLLTNALKYTDRGSVTLECADVDESTVQFTVRDTGDGIPDYVLASLSDGLGNAASGFRYSSSGLGLAICRALLEKMGSALQLERQTGGGTCVTFRVALPLAPRDPGA